MCRATPARQISGEIRDLVPRILMRGTISSWPGITLRLLLRSVPREKGEGRRESTHWATGEVTGTRSCLPLSEAATTTRVIR